MTAFSGRFLTFSMKLDGSGPEKGGDVTPFSPGPEALYARGYAEFSTRRAPWARSGNNC